MTVYEVRLPWTRPPLSMNDRLHWRMKARKVAEVREQAGWAIRATGIGAQTRVHVVLHYQPRDNRRRDVDNLVATSKPCVDACVDTGIVPDDTAEFLTHAMPELHPPVKGEPGQLWLVITTNPKD